MSTTPPALGYDRAASVLLLPEQWRGSFFTSRVNYFGDLAKQYLMAAGNEILFARYLDGLPDNHPKFSALTTAIEIERQVQQACLALIRTRSTKEAAGQ